MVEFLNFFCAAARLSSSSMAVLSTLSLPVGMKEGDLSYSICSSIFAYLDIIPSFLIFSTSNDNSDLKCFFTPGNT